MTTASPGQARGGRDRHGRGLRGPLCPPQLPLARTRAERFDDYVLDAMERLERRWPRELATVELAVEDVPPDSPLLPAGPDPVPLGRALPAAGGRPARLVLYRRAVELRAADPTDLAALVHDVVVEQVADLLGLAPEDVDPGYGLD